MIQHYGLFTILEYILYAQNNASSDTNILIQRRIFSVIVTNSYIIESFLVS